MSEFVSVNSITRGLIQERGCKVLRHMQTPGNGHWARAFERWQAGTPMIGSAIGLKAALDFLEQTGLKKAEAWEQHLLKIATDALQQIPGLRIIGTAPQKGPILTFTIDGVHPLDLAAILDTQNIAIRTGHLCAQPLLRKFGCEAAARASFAIYNTEDDVERFVQALLQNIVKIKM